MSTRRRVGVLSQQGWRAREVETVADVTYSMFAVDVPTTGLDGVWTPIEVEYVQRYRHELPGVEAVQRLAPFTAPLLYVGPLEGAPPLNGEHFVKCVDYKLFEAKVRTLDAAPAVGDVAVAAHHAVQFVEEWRAWVIHGEVVATTPYRWDQWIYFDTLDSVEARQSRPTSADMRVVETAAQELSDLPSIVLDYGRTVTGDWLVVEANCPNTSDWYGACEDHESMVAVVESWTARPGGQNFGVAGSACALPVHTYTQTHTHAPGGSRGLQGGSRGLLTHTPRASYTQGQNFGGAEKPIPLVQ